MTRLSDYATHVTHLQKQICLRIQYNIKWYTVSENNSSTRTHIPARYRRYRDRNKVTKFDPRP